MGLSVHRYLSSLGKSNFRQSPIFFGWTNPEDQDPDSPGPETPTSEPETVNLDWLVSFRQLCKEVDQDWAEIDREIWVSSDDILLMLVQYDILRPLYKTFLNKQRPCFVHYKGSRMIFLILKLRTLEPESKHAYN
jgi:hypothetical protein